MTENEEDEIIAVRIPRHEYEVLRRMIQREESFTFLYAWVRSWFVWTIIGGVIALLTFWDKLIGVVK